MTILYVLAVVMIGLASYARWSRSHSKDLFNCQLQAHRGFWLEGHKENSLQSFRRAKALGFKMCELDARLSADGIPVVHHDPYIVDPKNDKIFVSSLSAQELYERYSILSLWDVLNDADGTQYYNVEIKAEGMSFVRISRKIGRAIGNHSGRVLISSFHPGVLFLTGLYCPRIPKAYLVEKYTLIERLWLIFLPVSWVNLNFASINPQNVKKLKAKGFRLGSWTVNDTVIAKELLAMGIDSVITDSITKI